MDAGLRERPEARGWQAEVELVSGRRPRGLGVHGSEIVGKVLRAEALSCGLRGRAQRGHAAAGGRAAPAGAGGTGGSGSKGPGPVRCGRTAGAARWSDGGMRDEGWGMRDEGPSGS